MITISPSRILPLSALLVLPLLFFLVGCEVSCENTCEKLLACGDVDTPLVAEIDCEQSCVAQEVLYENWDDQIKRDALETYKACVSETPCADIADGACYHEDIYIW